MKIIISLLLLSLILGGFCRLTENVLTNQEDCPEEAKSAKKAKRQAPGHKLTQEQVDQFKAENSEVELLRENAGTSGRDSYVSIIKEVFHVKVVSKSQISIVEGSYEGDKEIYLNEHALWFFPQARPEDEDDYRNIPILVNLNLLVADTDLPAQNVCCDYIDVLQRDVVTGQWSFQVETPDSIWYFRTLVPIDQGRIEAFRAQLILHVIRASGETLNSALILSEPLYEDPSIWNWNDAGAWKHTCQSGHYQSPIIIETHKTVKKDFDFQMNYNNRSSNVNPVAQYNGKQIELIGDFGNVELGVYYDGQSSQYKFESHKITFNFKNEHVFTECDDSDSENDLPEPIGEMQVHHKTLEGQQLIVSFLIVDDKDALPNEFITSLGAEYWQPKAGYSAPLEYYPDIKTITLGGIDEFFDKSFYFYGGSETTPPCQEGILRIVMKSPIRANAGQLEPLMTSNTDNQIFTQGNARPVQPLNNRQVYYYEDKAACTIPELSLQRAKRALQHANNKDHENDYNFVAEKHVKQYVTYVHGLHSDPTYTSPDGSLKIEKVNADEIDPVTAQELQSGEVQETEVEPEIVEQQEVAAGEEGVVAPEEEQEVAAGEEGVVAPEEEQEVAAVEEEVVAPEQEQEVAAGQEVAAEEEKEEVATVEEEAAPTSKKNKINVRKSNRRR